MANLILSTILVGLLLIIIGILQSLVSSMIPELKQVLDYPAGVISALLAVPATLSFVMVLAMSFIFSKITVRRCIRLSAIMCVASMVVSAAGLMFDNLYASVAFAFVGRVLFGMGWVPMQSSLYILLRNRFSKSHMFVRNSLWNILLTFTFAGMGIAFIFTPSIMEMSIHLMAAVLTMLVVATLAIAMALPGVFAEYIDVPQPATTLNPPGTSLMHIVVISLHNFMTTGLWTALLLYLPSIIVDWKEQFKMIDITFFSSFVVMGMVSAFLVSLFVTTKNRWLASVGISTIAVFVGCGLTLADYADPMLGVAIVIMAASSFYMTPFIASNALFVGHTLYIAYQWIFASTFLGMSVFPAIFALTTLSESSSLIVIVFCLVVFGASGVVAYVVWLFFTGITNEEFVSSNLNFLEVVVSDAPTKFKNEGDSEVGAEPVVDSV